MFVLCQALVEPPDLAHKNKAEDVDEPEEGDAHNQDDDCEGDADDVFFYDAADQSVDHPDDVNAGEGKDELHKHGKIVKGNV